MATPSRPLALLAALLTACAAPAPQPPGRSAGPSFAGERDKEAVCVVEKIPNYVVHLTALAGLPSRGAYADTYGYSVDADAAQVLLRHQPLLQWGYGVTGDLAPFFVFLPTYLSLADEFALSEYLRLVDEAMRNGDYGGVRDRYHEAHVDLARWLFDFEGFFSSRAAAYREHLTAVRQLVRVYEGGYRRWEDEVWPQVEPGLEALADDLNGRLWTLDLLDTWERRTGLRFDGARYEIALTAAPAGTGVTGLGYARSLVSAGDPDRMLGLIAHEVGAHLLVDLYREASARTAVPGEIDWTTYAAYEGLAQYYTRQIVPGFETEIENDVEIFAGIYRQLQDEEPAAGARRLMERALAEHGAGRW